MGAASSNNLTSQLNVYSQEALQQFIASMPNFALFTRLFDTEIANGGQALVTRIPNTYFNAPNDLTQGWNDISASAATKTLTLGIKNYSEKFNELEWATLTENNLRNWFLPQMVGQLANGIVVDAINNVTSSVFTTTITVASSSAFGITGSTSLAQASTYLTQNEIPLEGRYAIVAPSVNQALMSGLVYQVFDAEASKGAIQSNKVKKLADFDLAVYPRFQNATTPQGGSKYSSGDKLIGLCGNKEGLIAAVRQPVEINVGTVWSSNATDPTSGLSLQVRLQYDGSVPVWRLAVVSVWATAAGNPYAIIPILTQSV
jgi:hypothetical protein